MSGKSSYKVDIIGAGIAGLCLGIRLRRDGYTTVIYEQSDRPGGLCTGWRRSDYDFNGCLHWLLGSAPGSSFHDMWLDVANVDSLDFKYFDERVDIEVPSPGGSSWHFHLYNDTDRLEGYLLSIAPQDHRPITRWMWAIRLVSRFLPDLPPYPKEPTSVGRLIHYMRLAPMWRLLPFMRRWSRLTNRTFAKQFQSPLLREALSRLYMDETRMTVVIFGQAYMAARVAGYPVGGSEALTNLLVQTYCDLGGELRLSTPVKSIRVDGSRAVGLTLADGTQTSANFVCSAADWRWTVTQALSPKWLSKAQRALLSAPKESIFFSYCRVHIGYAAPLDNLPHFLRLACCLSLPDGTRFEQLEVEVSNFDPSLAPQGHVTLTVNFTTREGQWWIDLRKNDYAAYRQAKLSVQSMVVDALSRRFPSFDPSLVEVVDVATPATFHRYTSNFLGSSQGWSPLPNQVRRLPVKPTLCGLGSFAMAGHWQEAGGGVPIALISALFVEKLVKRNAELLNFK